MFGGGLEDFVYFGMTICFPLRGKHLSHFKHCILELLDSEKEHEANLDCLNQFFDIPNSTILPKTKIWLGTVFFFCLNFLAKMARVTGGVVILYQSDLLQQLNHSFNS